MMPGMNPHQMQKMMQKLGMQQKEIPATEVIIKTTDKVIVITEPSVQKINMMGQETFQISGQIHEQENSTTPDISDEDVKTVMEQSSVSEEIARKAIEEADGDLAEAILKLSSQ